MRNEIRFLGIFAIWLVLLSVRCFAQSAPANSSQPSPSDLSSPLSLSENQFEQTVPTEIASECLQFTPAPPSNDGITVSMLDGKSQLKIFGSLSALTIFSTDRPFAPGLPFFCCRLHPSDWIPIPSIFTPDNRTLEHPSLALSSVALPHRQPSFRFIANDTLTGDSYGLLPYNAFGELKNEDWRFAAGLQSDVFNPRKRRSFLWRQCSPPATPGPFEARLVSNDSSSHRPRASTVFNSH